MYRIDNILNNKKVDRAISSLNKVYDDMPETVGCLEHIKKPVKDGGCGAWCCLVNNPHVLYSEFLNAWKNVLQNWDIEDIIGILRKAIENYLDDSVVKGCIFFDKETLMCSHHKQRPLACFTPDTWIFTEYGPKRIKDIMAGDYVYDINGNLNKVLYSLSKEYSGDIYNIKQQGTHIDNWCTADHMWLTHYCKDKRAKLKLKWVKASDLEKKENKKYGHYLTFPRLNCTELSSDKKINILDYVNCDVLDNKCVPFTSGKLFNGKEIQSMPESLNVNEDFLFMSGIYIAEGSSSLQSSSFHMHIKEKKHLEKIEKYLNEQEIRTHWTYKKNMCTLRVDSCIFARLMKSLFGDNAYNKAINDKLFKYLSAKEKMIIFESWHVGDGRKRDVNTKYNGVTVSEKLAIQMQQILLENNFYPRIQKEKRKNRSYNTYSVIVNNASYENAVGNSTRNTKIIYQEDNMIGPLQDIEKKYYQGPVFDLQVENTESFITSSGVAHNCRMYGITPEEEYKPKYERLKVLYPKEDIRPQCDLVSTKDGKKVTVKQSDDWWERIKSVEVNLGVPRDNIVDNEDGSYLTYHDHIILQFFPKDIIYMLADVRMNCNKKDKELTVNKLMDVLKSKMLGESNE